MKKYFIYLALIIFAINCKPKNNFIIGKNIDDNSIINADSTQWLTHGLNYNENRFSKLTQINKNNIAQLDLVWETNLNSKRGLEATPLIVDTVMYLSGVWSKVYALNAITGKLIWEYDPKVPFAQAERLCCDIVNRGVAFYKGKVFVGTLDGRLIALNATNGKLVWTTQTTDTTKPYSITGAPRVIAGNVIIGNGGAEFGVRGYISAYNAESGKQAWRFYTVPGNPADGFENDAMKKAAKTWDGNWWKYGGGGTAWDAMAYDPQLNLLYVGTGNGSPWDRKYRSNGFGDNLYLSSILALNPATGELVWHYQTTPGDSWDFTATQQIILADVDINGTKRKVLMQAPKNGFFYVLDRTNGKLISAKNFVYTNWAKYIDSITGRPVENEGVHYETMNTDLSPNYNGGHNWQPMAFNPNLNLVFIPARENVSNYGHDTSWKYNQTGFGTGNGWNLAIGTNPMVPTKTDANTKKFPRGMLLAWNPILQKEIWRVPQTADWNGGVLATASNLVFQGTAQGDFIAYEAETGKILWQRNLGGGIIAPPITYSINGKQYISIAVGWGGGYGMKKKFVPIQTGRVFTFAIGGKAIYPKFAAEITPIIPNIPFTATLQNIAKGETLFWKYCGTCHTAGSGGGLAPDLALANETTHLNFMKIVRDGAYLSLGMPKFGNKLNEEEIKNVQSFILYKAQELKNKK